VARLPWQCMARIFGVRMEPQSLPARWADALVDWIARHKATILAVSVAFGAILAASGLFVAFGEGDGTQLTEVVVKVGGYLAIVGLVLGLPALAYAMVTDRAVERLSDALGLPKEELKRIDALIDRVQSLLGNWGHALPSDHQLQIFVPNRQRTRLVPVYDPSNTGPAEGWEVPSDAPQAITGSAWVEDRYCYAVAEELKLSRLRLTSVQRKRYAHLTGVAAAPIHKDGGRIGVVTIFTSGQQPQMKSPEFIRLHETLATFLSPVIGDFIPEAGPLRLPPITVDQASSHNSGAIVG